MTKITISPADIRNCEQALSLLSAARQWAAVLQAGGVDLTSELDTVAANEKVATGVLQALQNADKPTL